MKERFKEEEKESGEKPSSSSSDTLSGDLQRQIVENPMTEKTVDEFLAAWKGMPKK